MLYEHIYVHTVILQHQLRNEILVRKIDRKLEHG